MRFSKLHKLCCVVALAVLGAAACSEVDDAGKGSGGMWLDLASLGTTTGALKLDRLKSFRVRVHAHTPPGFDDVLYDSGCLEFKGTAFLISPLEVGDGRSALLDLFTADSTADCPANKLLYRAYRGEIVIEEKNDHLYVLLPQEVGAFTSLSVPSAETMKAAGNTSCSDDNDCRTEVHAAAFCVQTRGTCAITSLHPLNNFAPRALHRTVPMADGSLMSVGGIGQASSSGALLGTDVTFERFRPLANLFEVRAIPSYSGEVRLAFHEVVSVDARRLLVLGGLQSMVLARAEQRLTFGTPVQYCGGGSNCYDNISNQVTVIDFGDATARTGTLPEPVFGTRAVRIPAAAGTGPAYLIAGGTVANASGDGVEATNQLFKCVVKDGDPPVECTTLDQRMTVPRSGHELFCLEEDDQSACTKVVIAGGHGAGKKEIADLYDPKGGVVTPLDRVDEGESIGGWTWSRVGDTVISIGGTTGALGDPPDVAPMRVTLEGTSIDLEPLVLDGMDEKTTYRVFPAVETAGDRAVVVSGGLDADNNSTTSVLRFRVDDSGGAGVLSVDELNMAVPRFAHTATLVPSGPLAGAVLVQGGFVLQENVLQFASGAELYLARPGN